MNIQHANVERFDSIASEWDSDPKRVAMGEEVARAMVKALAPTGTESALEFGAGTGNLTLVIARHVRRLTALDSSAGMLGVLRRKCEHVGLAPVEVIEGVVPDQLPDEHYDLIYSSMTLHHVEDVPGLMKTLAAHIRPGGRVALADLDSEDGGFHAADVKGVAHHGFARDSFRAWLVGVGFTDVRFSTAYTVQKQRDDGSTHAYPIFLAIARKPAA